MVTARTHFSTPLQSPERVDDESQSIVHSSAATASDFETNELEPLLNSGRGLRKSSDRNDDIYKGE